MSDVPPVKLSLDLPENIYEQYVYNPSTFTPNNFNIHTKGNVYDKLYYI